MDEQQFQEAMEQQQRATEGMAAGVMIFYVAFLVLMLASMWKIYTKAGKPGWAAIVPIYNIIVLLEIVGRPLWWVVLMLVPCVNVVVGFMVMWDLAKAFGRSAGFFVGMILLSPVFYPMLAFGEAQYQGVPQRA